MAFKEIKAMEEVSPNLIPMIDIMFLLLLFFMLNADMSSRELEELTPPIARHSEKEDKPSPDRITVNIHHDTSDVVDCPQYKNGEVCRTDAHWHISVSGRRYNFDKDGMTRLGQALFELGKTRRDPNDPKSISERSLIIRADRTAPYGYVQKVLEQATIGRIYKIEVGAGLPKDAVKQ
jgi:biopolymer transport protein ExbD